MTVISPKQFSNRVALRRAKARDAVTRRLAADMDQAVVDDCMQWALTALAMSGMLLLLQGLLRSAVAPCPAGRMMAHGLCIAAAVLVAGAALGVAKGLAHTARRAANDQAGANAAAAPVADSITFESDAVQGFRRRQS